MLNKKLIIFTIFLIGLLAVGAVSAADNTTDDNMIGEEPNPDLASQDTDVLTADEQSFTQLNQVINVNGNSEITLTSDYKYSDRDDSFKEGIVIDHDVTIYGNGHTIDGNNSARIFYVSRGNVVFYNITFTKGYAEGNGGAIYGKCKAINCTFSENSVERHDNQFGDGGAMYEGSAINCTFTENTAGRYGGAMYDCFARDCIFNHNSAPAGTAGAILGGSAVNCTFYYNQALGGGAIAGKLSAVNCSFIKNSEVLGVAINCYIGNCTGQNYFVGSEDLVLYWDVNDFTSSYNSGDRLHVNMKNQNGGLVDFINYDVVVYKDDVIVRTFHGLSGEGLSLDLAAGKYTAELIVTYPGLNQPDPKNISLTINKVPSKVEVSIGEVTYPDNVVVNVKSDVTAQYIVKIGNKTQTVNLEAGIAQEVNFTGLAANENGYIVSVESENYTGLEDTVKVVVHKATPKIEVSSGDVTYPDKVVVNVKSNVTGEYIVKVGDKAQTVNLEAGVAQDVIFTGLATNEKGYAIMVSHDSENYTGLNDSVSVKVKKATPSLTTGAKAFKFEDKTKRYTVTLKDSKGNAIKNTKVTLKVNGVTYTATTNANGVATFALNKLTKTGNAVITYSGDKNYNKAIKKVKLTVKSPAFKTVSYGSKNKAMVKKIQVALKKHGFYLKAHGHYLKVDGIFHKYTVLAVKQFQKANKLKVTGQVDYKTAKKLKIVK